MLLARDLIDRARVLLGTHVPQLEGDLRVFDTTLLPIHLALPARPYRPGELAPFVTVHVTAVTGGFGVEARKVKAWAEALRLGKIPVGLESADAHELALLERYSGCAYHWLASRAVGVVRNHPASLRTSHGNGGNRGLGWAIDCGHAEPLSDALVTAGFRALVCAIEDCHEATGEVVSVVPHRVWSGKRRVDTDARVWGSIVRPVVAALGERVCRIDYEIADGSKGGRPIPRTWDPSATHDDLGRRIL